MNLPFNNVHSPKLKFGCLSFVIGLDVAHAQNLLPLFQTQFDQLQGTNLTNEVRIPLSQLHLDPYQTAVQRIEQTNVAFKKFLHKKGLHPEVSIAVQNSNASVTNYQFTRDGFPICNTSARTVVMPDGATIAVGSLPIVNSAPHFQSTDWPSAAYSGLLAKRQIAAHLGVSDSAAKITRAEHCLTNSGGQFHPAWHVQLNIENLPYEVFVDANHVISANPKFFNVTNATVRSYAPNVRYGTLKDDIIPVIGDGTMTNADFTTKDYTGGFRANSPINQFIFEGVNHPNFAEASLFAYANQQMKFFRNFGFATKTQNPLTVIYNAKISGTVNNALFSPDDGQTGGPSIRVGNGDGFTLQNLPFDSTIVGHELGHLVIYESVTQIQGESLVLHEGLADFLVARRVNDPCIGPAICPEGSNLCSLPNKCLRTADNQIKYYDSTYNSYGNRAHLRGQLISGLLWDLTSVQEIPAEVVMYYFMKGRQLLPNNASVCSLAEMLAYIDHANQDRFHNQILAGLTKRNMAQACGISD